MPSNAVSGNSGASVEMPNTSEMDSAVELQGAPGDLLSILDAGGEDQFSAQTSRKGAATADDGDGFGFEGDDDEETDGDGDQADDDVTRNLPPEVKKRLDGYAARLQQEIEGRRATEQRLQQIEQRIQQQPQYTQEDVAMAAMVAEARAQANQIVDPVQRQVAEQRIALAQFAYDLGKREQAIANQFNAYREQLQPTAKRDLIDRLATHYNLQDDPNFRPFLEKGRPETITERAEAYVEIRTQRRDSGRKQQLNRQRGQRQLPAGNGPSGSGGNYRGKFGGDLIDAYFPSGQSRRR